MKPDPSPANFLSSSPAKRAKSRPPESPPLSCSQELSELKKRVSGFELRNEELEQELAALKERYRVVDEERRKYRKKYKSLRASLSKTKEDVLVKEEEEDPRLSSSEMGETNADIGSSRIKTEPENDEIVIEEEPAGVVIGLFGGGSQQQIPPRVELGMVEPSSMHTSTRGVPFSGNNASTREVEQFILDRLSRVAPLDDMEWSTPGIFLLDHRNIIWLGPSQEHALVLTPKTQSCPGYSLLSPYDSFAGQARELFVQKKDGLHYSGTYRCGLVDVDKEFKGDHGVLTHLMAKMCYEMQTQPESERLDLSAFETICDEGKIRTEWVTFQCVGYDEGLCETFVEGEGGEGGKGGLEWKSEGGSEEACDTGTELEKENEERRSKREGRVKKRKNGGDLGSPARRVRRKAD